MNRTIFSLLFLIFFISCNKQSDRTSIPRYLINPENSKTLIYSEVISDEEYLKLDIDSLNPIGSIDQLIRYGDGYFILDKRTNKVLKYSLDGKFKFVVSRQGKGPGEYVDISSISISSKDSLLVIFDQMAMAIRYYSAIDGSFKSTVKLDFLPLEITCLDEGKIAACMNFTPHPKEMKMKSPNNLIYFRDPEQILNAFLPFDPEWVIPNYSGGQIFSNSTDGVFFMPTFYDEVYALDSKSCRPILTLDFGKYNFRKEIFDGFNSSSERLDNLYRSNMVFSKAGFHEFDSSYFFEFSWKGIGYWALINKANGLVRTARGIKNDLSGIPSGIYIGAEGNRMFQAIEPYWIISDKNRFLAESKNTSLSAEERLRYKTQYLHIDSLFPNLSDSDNPVLGILTLK
jgi:hypothetical protein